MLLVIAMCLAWVLMGIATWQDYRIQLSKRDACKAAIEDWRFSIGGYGELPPFAYEELVDRVVAVAQSNTRSHLTAAGVRRIVFFIELLAVAALVLYGLGGR